MNQLHPGAKWAFRFGGYILLLVLIIGSLPLVIMSSRILFGESLSALFSVLIPLGIYALAFFILPEIYAQLAYKNWKYEFTKRELKLEFGIIFKKYKSIPYGKIQNVDISRGLFARMFNFSTLDIQTAGYSGGYGRYHRAKAEGHIPAVSVEQAEEIRELIMKKITGKKSSL